MSSIEHKYNYQGEQTEIGAKYLFISKGDEDIIKAVDYSPLGVNFEGKNVYNFGFGDYDVDTNTTLDSFISNNGDVYKVFNTALSTIPDFLENNMDAAIFVRGSDSSPDYIENCKPNCKRNCNDDCRNAHRRITVYRKYINNNFNKLSQEYKFYGGYTDKEGVKIEEYQLNRNYDSVLLMKKNV
jgi:hypothetical protein